jgi:hypothetical protein
MDTPLQALFWDEVWNIVIRINPALAFLANEGLRLFDLWG